MRTPSFLAVVGLVAVAGCGAGGPSRPAVASLPNAAPASTHSTTTVKPNRQDAVRLYAAWAACMRQHGVALVDPTIDDQGTVTVNLPQGMPLQTYQSANTACEALHQQARQATGQTEAKPNPGAMLAFSKCMRAHGLADFPDPSPGGGLQIKASGTSDLNPNAPAFQHAQKACQGNLPNHGAGGERITSRGPDSGAGSGGPGPAGGTGGGPKL